VRAELAPTGLTGLEVRGPTGEGGYEIHAAASPFERLVTLIPALGGPRAVFLEVTLEMHGQASLEGARSVGPVRVPERGAEGGVATDEGGRPRMTTSHYGLPPVIVRGRGGSKAVSGGVALPPEPGSKRIHLLTYNTSDEPRRDSNATHAEVQLLEFLERNPEIARDVRSISAEMNFSPCALCSDDLSHISAITPRAERRSLRWHDLYEHPRRGTTDASLRGTRGWDVTPGAVTEEGLTQLEVEGWAQLSAR
jgi:hypothetical protein